MGSKKHERFFSFLRQEVGDLFLGLAFLFMTSGRKIETSLGRGEERKAVVAAAVLGKGNLQCGKEG